MGLLNPTLGELVDRRSIVELKIAKGKEKGKDVSHFEAEYGELENAVIKRTDRFYFSEHKYFKFRELGTKLTLINIGLWELEDKVRVLHKRHAFLTEQSTDWYAAEVDNLNLDTADTSRAITRLNDERATTVADINALVGITGKEKLHDV